MAAELVAHFDRQYAGGPLIRLDNLRLAGSGAGITVLFGASGSGKTTVLRALAGLDRPDSGHIQFGEEIWFDHARPVFLPPQQRNIGYLSQDYALFPHLNVAQNIGYGLRRWPATERAERVAEVMRLLSLDGLEMRRPRQLSGGQQQRVALARAVVRRPRLLLLDEPLSALDSPTRLRLRGELRRWLRQLGVPSVVVTHDRLEALALSDHLVVMHQGQVVQSGAVHEVFSRPASLAVAAIVAVETVQPGHIVETANGLVIVALGNARLCAVDQNLASDADAVYVCIRAEDVVLLKDGDTPGSPRNRLPAVVQALTREGPLLRIDLDCGFPLAALLTKQACEELALKPGDRVMALVKAPNVHLIPR
ncbi:MAG: ABC transporter ATP-binding protein [Phycisphaerales bacterium]|nr:ABC transporter ATP-binding protein [Phycisphaerales bacterium]